MKKSALLLILLFSTFSAFSQYIEGKIFDVKTNEPIEGVHVYLKKTGKGNLTDRNGEYFLKIGPKVKTNDTIFISHVSYKTVALPYVKGKNEYSVYLFPEINKLDEVNIINQRKLQSTIKYHTLASMQNAIHSFGSTLIDDKIYVIGGDASFEHNEFKKLMDYDPENALGVFMRKGGNHNWESYKGDLLLYDIKLNTWETITKPKFRKRAYHNLNTFDNKIYVLGGKRLAKNKKHEYLDDKIEVFDLENNTIKVDDTNPHQAVDFASFVYKDNIIVMGGSVKKNKLDVKKYTDKVHLYDIKSGYWYQLDSMPVAKETQGVLINDKIYLIGGFNKKALSTIESFDLVSRKWKNEGELFEGINKPAVTSNNNIIYFFDDGKISTYNVITKELNVYLIDLYLKSAKLYFKDNTLYILGGYKETSYSVFPSNELFSIGINEFENTKIHKSAIF